MIRLIFFTIGILFLNLSYAQEVRISKDLDIRNYFSYDLVGNVNERIVLYRDRGFEKEIDIFDHNMTLKFNAPLNLEDKKAEVYHLANLDSCFQIIYSYNVKDSVHYISKKYDEKMVLVDSLTLFKRNRENLKRRYKIDLSEDKSKIVFYAPDKDELLDVVMVQNDSTHVLWHQKKLVEDVDVMSEIKETLTSNNGEVLFFIDKTNKLKKEQQHLRILSLANSQLSVLKLNLGDKKKKTLVKEIDNLNNRLIIAGFYNEKEDEKSEGLFIFNQSLTNLSGEVEIKMIPMTDDILNQINTSNKDKSKYLENFDVNNMVLRRDGGVILFAEKNKIFSRRNPYSGVAYQGGSQYSRRGWTDYYNEDIIAFALNPTNEMLWSSVLYKKQFSQDDDGIYSGYFLFKTPSRIRVLYNDEIKRNNTVSEYLLDPLGNTIRNSLLSTDYQNLKLRFQGAVQISPTAIVVPSESSYTLNIVKIEY